MVTGTKVLPYQLWVVIDSGGLPGPTINFIKVGLRPAIDGLFTWYVTAGGETNP